jgi:hypothetical protein
MLLDFFPKLAKMSQMKKNSKKKASKRFKEAKPEKPAPAPAERYTSVAQIARRLNLHPATISQWISIGCPGKADGAYDMGKIAAWRDEYKGKDSRVDTEGKGGAPPDPAERSFKKALEEKLLEHKTELARIQVEKEQGKLVDVTDMKEQLREIAHAIRRVLLTAHEGLAPRLVGLQEKEMKPIILRFMRDTCERLAKI